jgi:transcriptional regulator with XRE-family HTH domain
MTAMDKKIGARIKKARHGLGLTLADLGELVGVTRAAVHSWEAGRNLPRPGTLPRVARVLCLNEDYLRTGFRAADSAMETVDKILEVAKTQLSQVTNVNKNRIRLQFRLSADDDAG